ncbi:MAG: hypothetical protein ABR529_14015, partial [Actinomycetota bacterium]
DEAFTVRLTVRDAGRALIGIQVDFGDGTIRGGFGFDVCGRTLKRTNERRALDHRFTTEGEQSITIIAKTAKGCDSPQHEAILSLPVTVVR